ncbi:MAG: hypothetical protein ACLP7J_21310 [Streptosporangiaceae bacterium]
MFIALIVVAALVIAGIPLAAAACVTIASRREDSAGTLTGLAPGPLAASARRLVGFRADPVSPRRPAVPAARERVAAGAPGHWPD